MWLAIITLSKQDHPFVFDVISKTIYHRISVEEETTSNIEKLKDALTDPEKRQRFYGELWTLEAVADFLEKDVNRAINLFE